MRGCLAAFAALLFLAAPAASQPTATEKLDRAAVEAGRWNEQLGAALLAATEDIEALNQKVRAMAAAAATRESVAAAVPAIRQLIDQNRENVRRSNAMLESLPPFPGGLPMDIPAEQLVADGRAQNDRLLELLNHYDAAIVAMAKGDIAALNRTLPKMMEGAFALIDQQRLLFRGRQATVPATDSTHQALGIAVQIYRTLDVVARQGLAARNGDGSGAESAATRLRDELRLIARDTRTLTAAGRSNLKRELAEIEALRPRASNDPAAARLVERAHALTAAEEKSFEVGDRLAAYADEHSALTGAQLRQTPSRSLVDPLSQLESDFIDIGVEQAARTGEEPR